MVESSYKIVVSGDICINSLFWNTDPQSDTALSWQSHQNIHHKFLPGEALLLAKLVELSTKAQIYSPEIDDLQTAFAQDFLKAVAEVNLFPARTDKENHDKVYRVKRFKGFAGPLTGVPKVLPIANDRVDADMVIIDDENNGFNRSSEFWPLALRVSGKQPLVLYKMNNPSEDSALWKKIEQDHIEHTVVIINGDDLRAKGVNISKSLSWERTAQDFVWQIHNSPNLSFLAKSHHLIVLFGLEGAIYYKNDGRTVESSLYFLPYQFEGGSFSDNLGKMSGFTACFVAGIASDIVAGTYTQEELTISIGEGIRTGIVAAQKYFVEGFGNNIEKVPFPNPKIFKESEHDFIYKEHVQDVVIRLSENRNCQSCWYILKDKNTANLAEIAYSIVKNGVQQALKFIPIAQFGKLQTVDRTEIESYRSIKNLMCEYVSSTHTPRPLSMAVFGTPGSGKSFGVTEIAASIAPDIIKKMNFNLAQFRSPLELNTAFHKVRDLSLEGKIPLVFFDEFDSAFEGKLGWLKYFLAPMQDGVFLEGDSLHSIGKAIFVFAGGTSSTLREFCGEHLTDEQEQKQFQLEFRAAKGPDFLSRLRGYVNILGPNQTTQKNDQLFIVRRAMLLRALIERKAPHLINDKREAQIDNGVLRALLKIPRYKHESRSMEALLDMSLLTNAKKWEQSYLPSREQMRLHVDEEEFLRYLMHDTFFSEKIESLARSLHEKYRTLYKESKSIDQEFVKPWDELSEDLKNAARDQAKSIPNALMRINYDIVSMREQPTVIAFTDNERAILAAYQHSRWCLYKKETGWVKGEVKSIQQKTDPTLVDWRNLSEKKKTALYEFVKIWPEILAKAHFKIERMKFVCNCETKF